MCAKRECVVRGADLRLLESPPLSRRLCTWICVQAAIKSQVNRQWILVGGMCLVIMCVSCDVQGRECRFLFFFLLRSGRWTSIVVHVHEDVHGEKSQLPRKRKRNDSVAHEQLIQ